MTYKVFLDPLAQRQRKGLPDGIRTRVNDALCSLTDAPRPHSSRKLRGVADWRLRVGDYRIIYGIYDSAHEVVVSWIGLRRDAYKGN